MKDVPRRPSPAEVIRSMGFVPAMAVTSCGLGFLRPASGTWGSLPPAVVAAGLATASVPGWQIDVAMLLLLAIGCVACLRFGEAAERATGKKDPGQVVADEVAGQAVTLLALPWAVTEGWAGTPVLGPDLSPLFFNVGLAVAGFLLFSRSASILAFASARPAVMPASCIVNTAFLRSFTSCGSSS